MVLGMLWSGTGEDAARVATLRAGLSAARLRPDDVERLEKTGLTPRISVEAERYQSWGAGWEDEGGEGQWDNGTCLRVSSRYRASIRVLRRRDRWPHVRRCLFEFCGMEDVQSGSEGCRS